MWTIFGGNGIVTTNLLYAVIYKLYQINFLITPVMHKNIFNYLISFFNLCCLIARYLSRVTALALSEDTILSTRQLAAAYIASFLARANFASLGCVTDTLALLVEWAHEYIHDHSDGDQGLQGHLAFHAVCQAIFYILCFRVEDILGEPDGMMLVKALKLGTIVNSTLDPLQHCLKTITQEFTKIMKHHELLYYQSSRRRSVFATEIITEDGVSVGPKLEIFFPFDPYELKASKRFVESLYRVWQRRTDHEVSSDSDSSENEDEGGGSGSDDDFLPSSVASSEGIAANPAMLSTSPMQVPLRKRAKDSGNGVTHGRLDSLSLDDNRLFDLVGSPRTPVEGTRIRKAR
eukprot:m.167112 g.167112  ORF g.167112 m.167112 type:complete len:347 (-) comp15301_c0_seq1:1015-2055(-)